jgi:hypothetical protein
LEVVESSFWNEEATAINSFSGGSVSKGMVNFNWISSRVRQCKVSLDIVTVNRILLKGGTITGDDWMKCFSKQTHDMWCDGKKFLC